MALIGKREWSDHLWLNRAGWTEPKQPHLHYVLEFTALYATPAYDWHTRVAVDGHFLLRLMEGHDA